jgi:hypothetical protein
MKTQLIAAALFLCAGAAQAGIPRLNVVCPGHLEVHADEGGPVWINGKQTKLKKVNADYYEATGSGLTLSIAMSPDGAATVTYTGKHGANGICSASGSSSPAPQTAAGGTKAAEKACLAAVAKTVNLPRSKLSVQDVSTGESGISVMVTVPKATAPWSCLSDAKGQVSGVTFTGKDGD